MKVAIIHDYLNQYGGAERVLEAFMDLFPEAPVYTIICDLNKMPERFRQVDIRPSFIQSLPFSSKHYKKMIGLFPLAVEHFDLRGYDLILSTSSAFAKGILTQPHQLHICYCHTPMRFVWDLYHQYIQDDAGNNPIYKFVLPRVLHKLRIWDQLNAQRVDYFIANSRHVAKRIQKYYNRNSRVIHPPVDLERFQTSSSESFFLIVSRLIPYKRIDLAIQACNELQLPLNIIGDGYDRDRLRKLAGPTISFLGAQPDAVINEYYSKCRGFILAGEEDFGITPLEAQASGKPVIAYGRGGALETVIENETGLFFHESEVQALKEALIRFNERSFDPQRILKHARQFGLNRFTQEISAFITEKIQEFQMESLTKKEPTSDEEVKETRLYSAK